jgi:hypothetical protein
MNRYLLSFPNVNSLDAEQLIDTHLCGTRRMDNAFEALTDVFLFRSPLSIQQIEHALVSVVPTDELSEFEPWLLVQVADGRFGGTHPRGPQSRLERMFNPQ